MLGQNSYDLVTKDLCSTISIKETAHVLVGDLPDQGSTRPSFYPHSRSLSYTPPSPSPPLSYPCFHHCYQHCHRHWCKTLILTPPLSPSLLPILCWYCHPYLVQNRCVATPINIYPHPHPHSQLELGLGTSNSPPPSLSQSLSPGLPPPSTSPARSPWPDRSPLP